MRATKRLLSFVTIAAATFFVFSTNAIAISGEESAAHKAALEKSEKAAAAEPKLNIVAKQVNPDNSFAVYAVDNSSQDTITHCAIPTQNTGIRLTFDDSGSTSQIQAILTQLSKYNVRAMFFPTGQFADDRPDLIQLIKNEGHIVGNHSYSHPDLTTLSSTAVKSEVSRAHAAIKPYPTSRIFFRNPYGAGSFDTRINSILTSYNYQNCFWTVDTRDWSGSEAATIVNRVKNGDSYTPKVSKRGIVLMHMHGAHTAEALPEVISIIKQRGGTPKLY